MVLGRVWPDTALKTANSGYLTRRLVDVSQDCIVTDDDCGTTEGLSLEAVIEDGRVIVSISDQILGRTALEDVIDPKDGTIIVKSNDVIDEDASENIGKMWYKTC